MTPLLVFLGGGIGSLFRYLLGFYIPYREGFPWATFIANLLACFVFGYVISLIDKQAFTNSANFKFFFLTGFCGGFSTFSTFSSETLILLKNSQFLLAGSYIVLSLILGIILLYCGSKC